MTSKSFLILTEFLQGLKEGRKEKTFSLLQAIPGRLKVTFDENNSNINLILEFLEVAKVTFLLSYFL